MSSNYQGWDIIGDNLPVLASHYECNMLLGAEVVEDYDGETEKVDFRILSWYEAYRYEVDEKLRELFNSVWYE